MLFDQMSKEMMTQVSEFSHMESMEEIIDTIRENILNQLEEQKDFIKEFLNPTYAVMRLTYLSESQEESKYNMLIDLYKEKKLLNHLMDIQRQAIHFMREENSKMMKAWKIESEEEQQYKTMMSALKEMTVKEIVEV